MEKIKTTPIDNLYDLIIVGAGPAGLAAALEGAQAKAKILLIDENARPGGQLFKQIHKFFGSREHLAGVRGADIGTQLLAQVQEQGVTTWLNTPVVGLYEDLRLAVIRDGRWQEIRGRKVILATGASENALAFPGWTKPGVMGAGAAQTLINVHRVLPGKRILMVGSGNVGLIVTYQLLQAGADVIALIEAAPKIGGYGVHAAKLRRAGVPILVSHTIQEVYGDPAVEGARIVALDSAWQPVPGSEQELAIDTVCLAVGLSPLTELALMAGCRFTHIPRLGGHVPLHNEEMETTVPGLYIAGDITGVEEASSAMEEGRLAGVAAAQALGLLSQEAAAEAKGAIVGRLDSLRSGAFGEHRKQAKLEQIGRYGR